MGESFKRLHEQQDKLFSAEYAKEARLVQDRSESDTNGTSVVRELLESSQNDTETIKVTGESRDADGLLGEIEQSLSQNERTDYPVSEKLARIASQTWLQKPNDDQLKEKLTTYSRPANCEKLAVTQVNPEIWENLTALRDLI